MTTIADFQYGERDRSSLLTAVLAAVGAGRLPALVGQTFSLAEASNGHLAIESRETVAKTLLRSQQRVAAQGEEIVIEAHPPHRQHPRPQVRHSRL